MGEVTPRFKSRLMTRPSQAIPPKVRDRVRERSNGVCETRIPGCRGRATQMHHRRRRSRGGEHTVSNLMHVCAFCHTWIHENVARAKQLGWLA